MRILLFRACASYLVKILFLALYIVGSFRKCIEERNLIVLCSQSVFSVSMEFKDGGQMQETNENVANLELVVHDATNTDQGSSNATMTNSNELPQSV